MNDLSWQQTRNAAWRRSVDVRRYMTRRFVRRGASYWNAVVAANKLFPLAEREVVR